MPFLCCDQWKSISGSFLSMKHINEIISTTSKINDSVAVIIYSISNNKQNTAKRYFSESRCKGTAFIGDKFVRKIKN